jgi:hypothetical protein
MARRIGRRGLLSLSFCAALLLGAAPARAERAFDSALHTMPVDGYGLVLIDRARTPERFEFGLRAQSGWSYTPLRLNLNDARMGSSEQPFRVIEQQFTVDVGFFLGLLDFLSIGAAVPVAVSVYDGNAAGEPVVAAPPNPGNPAAMAPTSATGLLANQPRQNLGISRAGLRDPRVSLKLRFYGGRYFEIGSVLEATLPLGDSSSFLGERSATFRPRLVLGALLKRVDVLLSFGGIVRETATLTSRARSLRAASRRSGCRWRTSLPLARRSPHARTAPSAWASRRSAPSRWRARRRSRRRRRWARCSFCRTRSCGCR